MAEGEEIFYPEGKRVAVIGGMVVPTGSRGLTPTEITTQIKDVVAQPYMGKNVELLGMTLLEAALYSAAKKAAEGDLDALEKLLNRLMGKPIQQVVSATGTLKEFLDGIARTESIDTPATDSIDVLDE